MSFGFMDPYGIPVGMPMVLGGHPMMGMGYPMMHSMSSASSSNEVRESPTFTRNDVVAYAEGDTVKLAHIIKPFTSTMSPVSFETLGGATLHAETIPDDQTVEIETSEMLVVERGLRNGDIVVGKKDSHMEKISMPHPIKGERWIQKTDGRIGQVVGRTTTGDLLISGTEIVITDVPLDNTEHIEKISYDWNKKSASNNTAPPTSYARESDFYLYRNWIGEVLAQSNMVTLQWNDQKFTTVLGFGREAFPYERKDGAECKKKALIPGDIINLRISDCFHANWENGIPDEILHRRKSVQKRTDVIECTVKDVSLHAVLMSWLRPNPTDAKTVTQMLKAPLPEEITVEELKSATFLNRRRWPRTGDRIKFTQNDVKACKFMEWSDYETLIHNRYAEDLGLEQRPNRESTENSDDTILNKKTAEILLTHTTVDVMWCDGSVETLNSTDLCPANDLVEVFQRGHGAASPPLVPSQIVKRKKSNLTDMYQPCGRFTKMRDGEYGIVLAADEKECVATIRWLVIKDSAIVDSDAVEQCPYYDFEPSHKFAGGDMSRCGDLCMRTLTKAPEVYTEVFRVGKMQPNGQLICHFWDGKTEALWPMEITQMMSGYDMLMAGPDGELAENAVMLPNNMAMDEEDEGVNDQMDPEGDQLDWGGGAATDGELSAMDRSMRDLAILAGMTRRMAPTGSGLQTAAAAVFEYWQTRADSFQRPFFSLPEAVLRVVSSGVMGDKPITATSVAGMLADVNANKMPLGDKDKNTVLDDLRTLLMHFQNDLPSTEMALSVASTVRTQRLEEDVIRADEQRNALNLDGARELCAVMDMGLVEHKELLDELMSVVRGGKASSPEGDSASTSSTSNDISPTMETSPIVEESKAVEEPVKTEKPPQYKGTSPVEVLSNCTQHHFMASNSISPSAVFLKAFKKEIRLLGDLPAGIHVVMYEDRMDLVSAIIEGPADTPFEAAPFLFDIKLPIDYPANPPMVFYNAYSSEGLNPNLYQDGKVCLSLLGTWSGKACERWNPAQSNLSQVLLSIQGLILNSEPYWNEPGFELKKHDDLEQRASARYNEKALLSSLEYMAKISLSPPACFEDHIKNYMKGVILGVKSRLESWTSDDVPPPFPMPGLNRGFQIVVKRNIDTTLRALAMIPPKENCCVIYDI